MTRIDLVLIRVIRVIRALFPSPEDAMIFETLNKEFSSYA